MRVVRRILIIIILVVGGGCDCSGAGGGGRGSNFVNPTRRTIVRNTTRPEIPFASFVVTRFFFLIIIYFSTSAVLSEALRVFTYFGEQRIIVLTVLDFKR